MKILHINCNYIGTTLHQLMVEKLDSLGYENQVFVPTYDKKLSVITPNDNVIVSECFKKYDRVLFDYKQNKIFKALQKNIHVKGFDVIHAYTLFTDGNCARKLSEKFDIPYVVAIRNTDVNAFFSKMPHLRSRGIKNMRGAKAIFFLSKAYKNQVFDKYVPKKYHSELLKKSYIIPNGIDDFWFDNAFLDERNVDLKKEIKLAYAGKIDKNKNIPTIQKAMEILNSKGYNFSLTVVGKVCDKKEYDKIKNDKNTTFLSAMPKEKLLEVYRESDIFVMPSFTESFGLVYAEAMTQGLPVIYTKGQGFDGQFAEGEVGYSVSAHSALSVADGILKVVNNYSDIACGISQKADKFKWEKQVEFYSSIYEKCEDCFK